jgi:hypothetical protein
MDQLETAAPLRVTDIPGVKIEFFIRTIGYDGTFYLPGKISDRGIVKATYQTTVKWYFPGEIQKSILNIRQIFVAIQVICID